MKGNIIAIYTAATKHAEQSAVEVVQLKAGKGIVGDRYFGLRQKGILLNLTLIEAEVIEDFNRTYDLSVDLNAIRRNLITRGIQLNNLVGNSFRIGDVRCQGLELCQPCRVLARNIPHQTLSQTQIIKAFTDKGGLRAEVLSDGIIRLDDAIVLDGN